MTIQDYGSIGELIGATATVTTLAYLAFQIRQNSKLLQTSVTAATREGRIEINRILVTDDEAVRVFHTGLEDYHGLSEQDRGKFDALMAIVHEAWEHDYDLGIGLRDLSRWMTDKPGWRQWWGVYGGYYPSDFQEFLDAQLAQEPIRAAQQSAAANSAGAN